MKRMKRIAALLLALTLLTVATTFAVAAGSVQEALSGVARVVSAYQYEGESYVSLGTGFFIGAEGQPVEYMITNAHVVSAYDSYDNFIDWLDEVEVVFDQYDADSTMTAKVVKWFDDKDLAILRLSTPTTLRKPLTLKSSELAQLTEKVYAIGFPGAGDDTNDINATIDDLTVTTGTITKKLFEYQGCRFLQMDVDINPGNSGGPLVTDDGCVVAINTLTNTAAEGMNYALYIDYAMEYLNTMGIPYQMCDETTAAGAAGSENTEVAPTEAASTEAAPAVPVPVVTAEPETAEAGLSTFLEKNTLAVAIAGVVILAAAAVLIVLLRKRKPGGKGGQTPVAPVPSGTTTPVTPAQPTRQLVSIGKDLSGQTFTVGSEPVSIGRDATRCRIAFPASTPGVSAAHCKVKATPNGVMLMDIGSTYGTFLADKTRLAPNRPYELRVGEVFYLTSADNGFRVQ